MGVEMKKLLNEIVFFFFQWKQNIRNQQALRTSFLLQVAGMFINNIAFFVIWIMFSKTIGVINGWGAMQTFGMLCVSMLTFGIVHSLFGSTGTLTDTVPTG
jgi:ABC-2 type transport system permease protein